MVTFKQDESAQPILTREIS